MLLITACGGGGGGDSTSATGAATCAAFTDSFKRSVSCAEMGALAGANLPFLETSGGGGDSGAGDGGADGSAGDGAPIANVGLSFTDVNGKVVTTTTDANGYYRISLRGLKAPLIATVVRNSKPWKSMLVSDIVRAPANRGFYTINLTGLTDVVVSEVARKDGLSSPEAVTPAAVTRQKAQVPAIVTALNNSISAQITAAGLNPANFDPLTTPFVPNRTGYDLVLETVTFTKVAGQFTTVTSGVSPSTPTPTGALTGNWSLTARDLSGSEPDASYQGTFPGARVPTTLAEAGVLLITGYCQSNGTFPADDGADTITITNAVKSATACSYTQTQTSNSGSHSPFISNQTFVLDTYTGCGSCGVGSTVSVILRDTSVGSPSDSHAGLIFFTRLN